MAIEVSCRKCGKEYRVREERAGTKIRCKECEVTIAVPLVETEEERDETPLPPVSSGRAKADRKTKHVRKKSGAGSSLGIWVGVGVGLVVLVGLIVGLLKFLPSGAGQVADGTSASAASSWVKFTLPDGSASALFPGAVISKALPNGVMSHNAIVDGSSFGLSDKSPMVISEDFLEGAVKSPSPFDTPENQSTKALETINGSRCLRTTVMKNGELSNVVVTFIHNQRMYLAAVNRSDQGSLSSSDVEDFLQSITFH